MNLSQRLAAVESRNMTFMTEDFPIYWKRASGSEVWDEEGKRYIDFSSAFGVASIGHAHPRVVAAIAAQSKELIHGMGDVHPSRVKVELLEKLAALYGPPAKSILSLNGSDAVESAIKTAVMATGRNRVIAFDGGYHGLGYGALAATAQEEFRKPFAGQLGNFVTHFPFPVTEIPAGLEQALASREYAAVLIEPIQGRGGLRVPAPGALRAISDIAHEMGTLTIFDEIMTGFGRTGLTFAWEHEDVRPDILCVGKALGGGIPISAAIAQVDVMDAWPPSDGEAIHTSTFTGHPLACRVALEVLRIMEDEALNERARETGEYIMSRLSHFHPRGRGMMIGIECKTADAAGDVAGRALKNGLILLINGTQRNVITLLPALNIARGHLDEGLEVLEKAMA